MGKIRTRIIGLEDVEKKQKQEQKRRSAEKKHDKVKIRAQGLKGGERLMLIEVGDEAVAKMEKAKKILESAPAKATPDKAEKKKKVKAHVYGEKYKKAKKEIEKFYSSSRVKNPDANQDRPANASASTVRQSGTISLEDAIKLLKKIKYAKFDESVELHLNVDKEGLKCEVELPHSTGKTTRVKIVDDKLLDEFDKGRFDFDHAERGFDVLITHPQYMSRLAGFAKVLGPKGLMPNPKAGTISEKPEEIAKNFSKGAIRWKTEAKAPLIHQMIGKISLQDEALIDNASAFLSSVGINHIQSAYLKSSMSPSIKINVEKI